jgi:RNA recognition motif-containing protein
MFLKLIIFLISLKSFFGLKIPNSLNVVTNNAGSTVFIGNLPLTVDMETLTHFVNERYGSEYSRLRLVLDRKSGKSRGYAYADFADSSFAENMVKIMHNSKIDDRVLRVNLATPPSEKKGPPEYSVFIANLSFASTKESIISMINVALGEGKVRKVRIAIDRITKRSRGFAHVDFVDEVTAKKALVVLQNMNLDGRNIKIEKPLKGLKETSLQLSAKDENIYEEY